MATSKMLRSGTFSRKTIKALRADLRAKCDAATMPSARAENAAMKAEIARFRAALAR